MSEPVIGFRGGKPSVLQRIVTPDPPEPPDEEEEPEAVRPPPDSVQPPSPRFELTPGFYIEPKFIDGKLRFIRATPNEDSISLNELLKSAPVEEWCCLIKADAERRAANLKAINKAMELMDPDNPYAEVLDPKNLKSPRTLHYNSQLNDQMPTGENTGDLKYDFIELNYEQQPSVKVPERLILTGSRHYALLIPLPLSPDFPWREGQVPSPPEHPYIISMWYERWDIQGPSPPPGAPRDPSKAVYYATPEEYLTKPEYEVYRQRQLFPFQIPTLPTGMTFREFLTMPPIGRQPIWLTEIQHQNLLEQLDLIEAGVGGGASEYEVIITVDYYHHKRQANYSERWTYRYNAPLKNVMPAIATQTEFWLDKRRVAGILNKDQFVSGKKILDTWKEVILQW